MKRFIAPGFRQRLGHSIKEFFISVIKGDTLIRMRLDKTYPHVGVTFLLILLSIVMSLKAEQTTLKVEKNKEILEGLKNEQIRKTYEIVGINRLSTIEQMLEQTGSKLKAPGKPAEKLK